MSDAELVAIVARLIERERGEMSIAPAWIAMAVLNAIMSPELQASCPLLRVAALLRLRQMVRSMLGQPEAEGDELSAVELEAKGRAYLKAAEQAYGTHLGRVEAVCCIRHAAELSLEARRRRDDEESG